MGKKDETKEKPLEKMTAKELRELGLQIPEISGVHGMNKEELIAAIKKAKGIEEKTKGADTSVRELKFKMKELKTKRETALQEANAKMAQIYKSRMIQIKKKTRRLAKAG